MMGSCGGMSASLCRFSHASWCLDSAEPPTPAAETTENLLLQNQLSPCRTSIPVLTLSPIETAGGEVDISEVSPHQTFSKRKHRKGFRRSCLSQLNPHPSHSDEREEGSKNNFEPVESFRSKEKFLRPEDETFHLPRSSPVISKHHRPISWHGGEADTPSSARVSGPPSLDQRSLSAKSVEDLSSKPSSSPAQAEEKQRCVSLISNLNRLLSGLTGLYSGQQGAADEHRGRSLTAHSAARTTGLLSTSTQHTKERRCSSTPDFSAGIFRTSCELEKENSHFIVVDMVLEVLESVKWTLSFNGQTSKMEEAHTHCKTSTQIHTDSSQARRPHRQICEEEDSKHSDEDLGMSHRDAHTGSDEIEPQVKMLSVLSTDSGFEDCGVNNTLLPRNAECLAQQLVMEFKRSWLPSHQPRRGRLSLRSSLQELPGTGEVAVSSNSLTEEIRLRTRMRGSLTWAPPRFQIIFTVQPTHRRSDIVALQHFLCAGCGTEVEPKYIKKLRYCDYLGRYFCDCCHSGLEAVIPGRVLSCWDFSKYSVSDFSKGLLDSVWHQPLFDLSCVGKTLYSRVKELDKLRELQEQLMDIKKLLSACRLSGGLVAEFQQLPAHLLEQLHLFSMDDLMRVKKGHLGAQARAVLHAAIEHVEHCELCLARGFICEFCREKEIIFPFQRDICKRCTVCKACFHKQCFVEKRCPKCARIQSRKKRP
ncbi:protein RUBCNL-like [Parambassis ranga]|uniref:Protein RUBCNL-like n=1 Tax=Parambassis ranga TaxID=210632 RepID=A0A6P7HNJ4_9TELE|nr:protein RUBCNL-like [Parambassis ranga]